MGASHASTAGQGASQSRTGDDFGLEKRVATAPQQGQRAPWHSWEYEFISLLASNPWVLLEFITHNQILEAKQALNWIRQLEFFCAPQNKGSFCRFRVHHL
jgi:hypothetical protein